MQTPAVQTKISPIHENLHSREFRAWCMKTQVYTHIQMEGHVGEVTTLQQEPGR